jgi:hypothetical protein
MIDAPAIAAATTVLRRLLREGMPRHDALLAQVDVTSAPPDKMNANVDRATLNVFLYRVATPPTLRNLAAGRTASPPTGLTLQYLLTAHGRVDQEAGDLSHRVLGAAIRVLQSSALITAGELEAMLPSQGGLTMPHTMAVLPVETSLDEMATIWAMFHTGYRLSTVCEVRVLSAAETGDPASEPDATDVTSPDGFTRAVRELGLDPKSADAMQRLRDGLNAPKPATGQRALFAGDNPQLHSRAAQLLAKAGQRGLHRVDLAALSDQYIGETEKNLRRIFEEAENAQAILFFDEADALFGKRTEVRSAHDRYANIDVSQLISQLDAFSGLVIIATVQPSSLDPAILRRFRIAVEFTPVSLG